jgi:tetratricopeptide (TPR) repeat protein
VKARAAALTAAQAQRLLALQKLLPDAAALPLARALAQEAPNAPDARHALALALAAVGTIDDAATEFAAALALAPDQPMILANFARMLRRAGRVREAVPLLQARVRVAPAQAAGWIDLGVAQLDLGAAQLAREALLRATALAPNDSVAWQALGSACRSAHDLDAAAQALERALALAPASVSALANLGAVQRLRGRPREALRHYDQALSLDPSALAVQDARTGVLLDDGRLDEALQAARRLVEARPDYVHGQVTLAQLLWEHGARLAPGADPVAALRAASAQEPANFGLSLALARMLIDAQRASEALDLLARIPADTVADERLMLQADALGRLDRLAQAEACFAELARRGALRDPDWIGAHVRHLLRTQQPERAAAEAQRALAIDPDHQASWAHLATAWRLLDDPRELWLCDYERCCALVPVDGFADDRVALDRLEQALLPLHQAAHAPMQQSLRGGSQTSGRLFGRDDPELARTRAALLRAVEAHLARLPRDPAHPFLRRLRRSVHLLGSWSVRLWSAGRHVDHIHHEGWMSSAFYVALPASMRTDDASRSDAGCLLLGRPPVELGLGLEARRVLRPQPGHLALFPSYVWHGTAAFHDEQPRLTIAFDMQPRD